MPARERLRLLLDDAGMSRHTLLHDLTSDGHDVVAAGFRDDLKQRLREREHDAIVTFGEMKRRFARWFSQFPSPEDWLDRAVHL